MSSIRVGSEKVWVRFVLGPKRFGSESSQNVCINGPDHMTKMAAMAINSKKLSKISSPEPKGL